MVIYCLFTGAERVTSGVFEAGNETYILNDVECTGNEQSLRECAHSNTPCHRVGREDAGVRCKDRGGLDSIHVCYNENLN